MIEFVAVYLLFIASHMLPARPATRQRLVAAVGEWQFNVIYGLVSVAMLVWLISAAGRAAYIELWPLAPWQLWVPVLVMPLVCLLGVFGVAVPNPLSFGDRNSARFDPQQPGIVGLTRHPLLWAVTLWGFAHLFPSGNLAHVALFGGTVCFGVLGMVMLDRRKRRLLGDAEWSRLAARTSLLPFAALRGYRAPLRFSREVILRLAVAVLLFAVLIGGHRVLLGVSPLPSAG